MPQRKCSDDDIDYLEKEFRKWMNSRPLNTPREDFPGTSKVTTTEIFNWFKSYLIQRNNDMNENPAYKLGKVDGFLQGYEESHIDWDKLWDNLMDTRLHLTKEKAFNWFKSQITQPQK